MAFQAIYKYYSIIFCKRMGQVREVFQYTNYRDFLNDYLRDKRNRSASYSLELLSQKIGTMSKSYLSLVLNGKRNLGESKILDLGRSIELSGRSLEYFHLLVRLNQAKDLDDRSYYFKQLCRKRLMGTNKTRLGREKYQILESWHYIAILELMRLSDFELDYKWIQQRLKFSLSQEKIHHAIELLKRFDLVQLREGSAYPAQEVFSSQDEVPSTHVQNYHLEVLDLGKRAALRGRLQDKEFQSITLPTDPDEFMKLKKMIKEFINESLKHNGKKTELAQLNIQLFKLTKPKEGQ